MYVWGWDLSLDTQMPGLEMMRGCSIIAERDRRIARRLVKSK